MLAWFLMATILTLVYLQLTDVYNSCLHRKPLILVFEGYEVHVTTKHVTWRWNTF